VAQLPVPRRAGPDPGLSDGAAHSFGPLPEAPRAALSTLIAAGHEAVIVGGCVRDLLLGLPTGDWDLATSATPDVVSALFPGSYSENRFGTVAIPGDPLVEITSYRSEAAYRDRRHPDEVRFGSSLGEDLARRDFTINAIAWRPDDESGASGILLDPHGGLGDLRGGVVRAVGDPADRFGEDALRLLRAVRFSLRFGFKLEDATERALIAAAPTAATLSGERVRDELNHLLHADAIRPSVAFTRWEAVGLLVALLPELAALRGVPQGKALPGDALDHSLRTADALPAADPILRLAGLLHDIGKAETYDDGHFIGHEVIGAEIAGRALSRLRYPAREIERVTRLIRQHMFSYDGAWTDAAVRRFIGRVGRDALPDLFALREADNAASGVTEPASGGSAELRARIAAQRDAPLETRQLAIDGHDLLRELELAPGPRVGQILAALLDAVVADPRRNERSQLLALARDLASGDADAGR
jgi:tRNA nucleotidyltransferase (CCA-adding enzyme)